MDGVFVREDDFLIGKSNFLSDVVIDLIDIFRLFNRDELGDTGEHTEEPHRQSDQEIAHMLHGLRDSQTRHQLIDLFKCLVGTFVILLLRRITVDIVRDVLALLDTHFSIVIRGIDEELS